MLSKYQHNILKSSLSCQRVGLDERTNERKGKSIGLDSRLTLRRGIQRVSFCILSYSYFQWLVTTFTPLRFQDSKYKKPRRPSQSQSQSTSYIMYLYLYSCPSSQSLSFFHFIAPSFLPCRPARRIAFDRTRYTLSSLSSFLIIVIIIVVGLSVY